MVKRVILDCALLRERESAHEYLKSALDLPDWYGRNLDALYDCLTELHDVTVVLKGPESLSREEGYGGKILRAIEDAALENPGLHLVRDASVPAENER